MIELNTYCTANVEVYNDSSELITAFCGDWRSEIPDSIAVIPSAFYLLGSLQIFLALFIAMIFYFKNR